MMTPDWDSIEVSVLGQLKPFQRRTAEWAFSRLYSTVESRASRRFLVADEVGLGKTLIAKGIIAKALRHLQARVKRIDIVYICSNRDIARQNLSRLRIDGLDGVDFTPHDRLTLLPLVENWHNDNRTSAFRRTGVNMISLTPGTSLELSGGTGLARERALILLMLKPVCPDISETRLRNMLHFPSELKGFTRELEVLREWYFIDPSLQDGFGKAVRKNKKLFGAIHELSESFSRQRSNIDGAAEPYVSARKLIGELRQTLATVCIDALEPDLVILDEFQRFAHLLTPSDEQAADAELAQRLFDYSDKNSSVRVLLLSATPYQMFSVVGERASDQHYAEFMKTSGFLFGNDIEARNVLEGDLGRFNSSLFSLHDQTEEQLPKIIALRKSIEARLRSIMVRTDRVNATDQRDAMISTVKEPRVIPNTSDIVAYACLQKIAEKLGQPDLLEYWRSAPYPLSFLSGYGLQSLLKGKLGEGDPDFDRLLNVPGVFLPPQQATLRAVSDLPNARLRKLVSDLLDAGMAKMLWIPPSLPYYALGGAYSAMGDAARTKRLVFSSWRMVPRALSVIVSESFGNAVAQMYRERHGSGPKDVSGLLKFAETGGGAFALRYPCWSLATRIDPITVSKRIAAASLVPSCTSVIEACAQELAPEIRKLERYQNPDKPRSDERWYWFAPLLLDRDHFGAEWAQWFGDSGKLPSWLEGADALAVLDRMNEELQAEQLSLGRMPGDLLGTIAALAIAGPGVCALRSIRGTFANAASLALISAAAGKIANSFQTNFNTHDSAVLIRAVAADKDADYWRQVLWYCGEGCIQAVIDEYVHVLVHDKQHKAPTDQNEPQEPWDTVAECICIALGLKPATLVPDSLESKDGIYSLVSAPVRGGVRHARPLLEDKHETDREGPTTTGRLRDAFNSPFLPFVLSSTSIGQEGLDFHWYCHAIVHWNLPWNPVNFDQRDGRIHRFKNHAVRKNLAFDLGFEVLQADQHENPWTRVFLLADDRLTRSSKTMDGMKPCWLYERGELKSPISQAEWFPNQFGRAATIERHIPMIPLSQDEERYDRLQKSLAAYRLVFGQPRQEDMLRYLQRHFTSEQLAVWISDLAIDLSPP